jgi:outer membrane lipoprotein-sorting protein
MFMRKHFPLPTVIIFLFFLLVSFDQMSVDKIMMHMESQSLHRGKVVRVEADLFFHAMDGRMITRYIQPAHQVMVANNKGEVALYNERENTVVYRQGHEYSTESGLIQFFLQGKTRDLGLSDFGFQQMSTEFKDNLVITEWFPPSSLYHVYNRIELVHEDFMPIFVAYYDATRKLAKKVYYSDFQYFGDVYLPGLVTEFNYIGNDSIINRIRFSDIKVNHQAVSPWFNFEIPSDAKLRN